MLGPGRVAQPPERFGRVGLAKVRVEQVRAERREARVERLGSLLEQLDDRRVEADRDRARDLEDEAGSRRRPAPPLARAVAVPRAGHPQVRPQLQAVVEPDQRGSCRCASTASTVEPDDPLDLRSRASRPGGGHRAADQVRPKAGRGPEERVALGHGGGSADRGAGSALGEPAVRPAAKPAANPPEPRRGTATPRRARRRPS